MSQTKSLISLLADKLRNLEYHKFEPFFWELLIFLVHLIAFLVTMSVSVMVLEIFKAIISKSSPQTRMSQFSKTTKWFDALPKKAYICYVLKQQSEQTVLQWGSSIGKDSFIRSIIAKFIPQPSSPQVSLERKIVIYPPVEEPFESSRHSQGDFTKYSDSDMQTFSPRRMNYLDLSMKKYKESNTHLYKQGRPIVFRFLPNDQKSNNLH